MTYAVVSIDDVESLRDAVAREFPKNDYLTVGPSTWLVAVPDGLSAEEVGGRLGLNKLGSGLITKTEGGFGWASGRVWDWLAAKAQA